MRAVRPPRNLSDTFRKSYAVQAAGVKQNLAPNWSISRIAPGGMAPAFALPCGPVPRRKATSRPPPVDRPFASTEELLDIVKMSRRTLYEWVQRSLLPIPRTMSDGNGVWSRWPRNAIDHARFIVEQRALGYAFDEIRPILHARWGSADKVPLEEVEVREAKIKAAKTKGREEPS